MKFDRKQFYDGLRGWWKEISPNQVSGLNFLLAEIERDKAINLVTEAAYLLATPYHETAKTMLPIREYGKGHGRKYAKIYTFEIDGKELAVVYYGRGFVQLTWYDNYLEMTRAIKENYPALVADFEARTGEIFNLVYYPDQALDPQIAYAVMSYGMRNGVFGAKLGTHINEEKTDYINARRSVNITDKAKLIAGYAEKFEDILNAALISPPSQPEPSINPTVQAEQSAPVLRVGAKGANVNALQMALASKGFLRKTEIDGIFGNRTRLAVIDFQKKNKLTADGIVGAQTRKGLGI